MSHDNQPLISDSSVSVFFFMRETALSCKTLVECQHLCNGLPLQEVGEWRGLGGEAYIHVAVRCFLEPVGSFLPILADFWKGHKLSLALLSHIQFMCLCDML